MRDPAHYDDLDALLAAAWTLLARGVTDRTRLAHTPVLATVGADGAPAVRTVVLRGCDANTRTLTFHTDRRSAKLEEIRARPAGTVHVYEPSEKVQLRLRCTLAAHVDDDVTDARWAATRARSRACYQVEPAPGTPIADPADVAFDAGGTQDGRTHFAVVTARVTTLEWLYLAAHGHRRARFTWSASGATGTWLVP